MLKLSDCFSSAAMSSTALLKIIYPQIFTWILLDRDSLSMHFVVDSPTWLCLCFVSQILCCNLLEVVKVRSLVYVQVEINCVYNKICFIHM